MAENKSTVEEILTRLDFLASAQPGSGIDGTDFVREQLEHENVEVRTSAAECAWEWPAGETAGKLLELARNDPERNVRVAAIKSLGWYMSLGEDNMYEDYEVGDSPTGELIEETVTVEQYQNIRDFLLETYLDTKNRSLDERRYALEAVSFVSREDVEQYIEEAYESDENKMVVSAVFSMGRNAHYKWKDKIKDVLNSADDEIRFEAIRASGKCDVQTSRKMLRNIINTTRSRSEFEHCVLALAQLGHTDSFSFFDNLQNEVRFDVEPEFADYMLQEWMLYNNIRNSSF